MAHYQEDYNLGPDDFDLTDNGFDEVIARSILMDIVGIARIASTTESYCG